MMQMKTLGAALAVLILTALPGRAAATVSDADREFMSKAAQGGLAEVQLGAIASRRGAEDGKMFGRHMVKDHTKANNELIALAKKLGFSLPQKPTDKQMADIRRLDKLQGQPFDAAYLSLMHADHEEDIALFKREASQGMNPELKAWAAKTLPTLQMHLAMDVQMLAGHGGGAGH